MTLSSIEAGDPIGLLRRLVQIDSRNPTLVAGAPGEYEIATELAAILRAWGFAVELIEAAPGRPNVVARIGPVGGRSIMLNGHLDVVGVEGMVHEPFAAEERGSRLYGRGSADMKAGVAAMCAAAWRAHSSGTLDGEIVIAAVIDEEYESLGTRALLAAGVRADAAVVTEPTRLAICPAHRGFVWTEVTVHGRAAHGSRYDIGVDAIRHAGLLLAELDALDAGPLHQRTHPLLGHASLHASLISGGTGMSTYPDRCSLSLERRTVPGETTGEVVRELEAACERVRARRPTFNAEILLLTAQGPSDVAADAPLVRQLGAAIDAQGIPLRIEGLSAWTDAALLNDGGIPAVCFGPGDISLAHAAEEWVELPEVRTATEILERFVVDWCGG